MWRFPHCRCLTVIFSHASHDSLTQFEDPVGRAAGLAPDAPAIIHPEGALSYNDLDRFVDGTASAVAARTDASRAGLVPARTWESVVLVLALLRAHRTACLISSRWPRAAVERAVRLVGAAALVTGPDTAGSLVRKGRAGVHNPLAADMPATIVYTTGSTGEPKAALHSMGNLLYSAHGANKAVRLHPGDRWLLTLPLYHVGGLGVVFRCVASGAAVVVARRGSTIGALLRGHRCTHVSLVATQLLRLLREDDRPAPDSLKAMIVGGSGIPQSLLQEAYARGYPVCTTYGLTEMTSQVATLAPGAQPDRLCTAGKVLPYRSVRIGPRGEIQVKGRVLFMGYVTKKGLHRSVDAEGWFTTGDLGCMDADGYLHVRGRTDNMFVSGGENIVPEEIEQALCAISGVERAIVVPVPDETFAARPVAFVAGRNDWPALACALEKRLPRFKIPAFCAWPAAVPYQGIKVSRAALKKLALSKAVPQCSSPKRDYRA